MKRISIKILIATPLIVLLTFNACDLDRLDTPPLSITEAEFPLQQADFDLLIINAYAKMTDWYWYRGSNGNSAFLHDMYYLMGDDITEPSGPYSTYELFSNINTSSDKLTYFFDKTYELIQRANVVIEKTQEADPTAFEDPSFLDVNRGEALFLRALAFFKLYNMYGTAPIVIRRITTQADTNTPRSEGVQLLDQAIADLQAAIPLLPTSWDDTRRGRVTKNSANGLLLKTLVFRGDYTGSNADYTTALAAYNAITATLTVDYTDNFDAHAENNSESLFEYQASKPNLDNVWLYNDGPWRGVETMSTVWGFYTVVSNSGRNNVAGSPWRVTQKMAAAYGTDPRVDFFTEADRSFTKYGMEGLDELSGTAASMNNVRILRYAESKLLAAEATLLSGGSAATAIGLINEVRARANAWATDEGLANPPAARDITETDTDVIMQWIEDERVTELLGEEQIRWFDLKRWDARGYKDISGWDGSITGFSTDLASTFGFDYPTHLIFPIPQDEVTRNSAITDNNPGYN